MRRILRAIRYISCLISPKFIHKKFGSRRAAEILLSRIPGTKFQSQLTTKEKAIEGMKYNRNDIAQVFAEIPEGKTNFLARQEASMLWTICSTQISIPVARLRVTRFRCDSTLRPSQNEMQKNKYFLFLRQPEKLELTKNKSGAGGRMKSLTPLFFFCLIFSQNLCFSEAAYADLGVSEASQAQSDGTCQVNSVFSTQINRWCGQYRQNAC